MSSNDSPTARATRRGPVGPDGDEPVGTEPTIRGTRRGSRRRGGDQTIGTEASEGPTVLNRYRLARRLGTGAFGTVWKARDEHLERDVAVKILSRECIVGGRFEREARAAARLSHPAIVTLYEAAVDDEGAYLVSELVNGTTLDTLLAAGRLSDRDIVAVGLGLCDALEHAHAEGVVHRDVKPSNILVLDAPPNAAQVAKLTDFGVARVVGSESLTLTGDVIGTLAYMAPEQADGLPAGPAADLYSLALVLYEALTGVNPVARGATQRSRRLAVHLPPVRRQRRDLPRELGQGIDLALRPRPGERGSIGELRRALAAAAPQVGDEPGVVAPPATPWTTIRARPDPGDAADTVQATQATHWADATRAPTNTGIRSEATPAPERRLHPTLARGLAAAAAGAVTAWLVATALASPILPPAMAGLIAAAAVLLLPRLGWAALIVALSATAAAQGRSGVALVLLVGLLLPVLLLPRQPALWPLAAGSPALGLVGVAGLAGAWPALAGRAPTPWRRASLGALGWAWLLLAAPLAGRALYVPVTAAPLQWSGSLHKTTQAVLDPMVRPGVLAPVVVWVLAAAVLPWVVRGRDLRVDIARAVLWAAILTIGISLAGRAAPGAGAGSPPGVAVGAAVAVGFALAPAIWYRWRSAV